MYYIAVVNGPETLKLRPEFKDNPIRYAEHYESKTDFDWRRPGLDIQAVTEASLLWCAEEPYECELARMANPPTEGEDFEDWKIRVAPLIATALANTKSQLKVMIDDRPEWFKAGYGSKAEYDAHNAKP